MLSLPKLELKKVEQARSGANNPASSLAWAEQSQCFVPYFLFLRISQNRHDYDNLTMIGAIWSHSNLFLVFICLYRGRPPLVAAPNTIWYTFMTLSLFCYLSWCLSCCVCLFSCCCPCPFHRLCYEICIRTQSVLFYDQRTDKEPVSGFGHLKTNAIFMHYILISLMI